MAIEQAMGTPKGREAALFYLFAYTFMVIGSFAVVTVLSSKGVPTPVAYTRLLSPRSRSRRSSSGNGQ